MNYSEIATRISQLYPHGESQTSVIAHINSGLDELSLYFGKLIIDDTLVTVASQDNYAFPLGLTDVSEIRFVDIANSVMPSDRFDYVRYSYSEMQDGRPNHNAFYQIYSSDGSKSLGIYPIPVTADLIIRITYQKKLTDVSASTLATSPDFDSRYHDLLVYYGCHMICSSGASPDAIQADSFMQKFTDGLSELWRLKMEKSINIPLKRKDNSAWHR